MRINNIKQLNFKSSLVSKCTIPTNKGKPISCNILSLESKTDANYFAKRITSDYSWRNYEMADEICGVLPTNYDKHLLQVYSIEDTKGNCLALCRSETRDDVLTISKLETRPDITFKNNPNRKIKHAGSEMIKFLIDTAKKTDKKVIIVDAPAPSAIPFYKKLGFHSKKKGREMEMQLEKQNNDTFKRQKKLPKRKSLLKRIFFK